MGNHAESIDLVNVPTNEQLLAIKAASLVEFYSDAIDKLNAELEAARMSKSQSMRKLEDALCACDDKGQKAEVQTDKTKFALVRNKNVADDCYVVQYSLEDDQ